MAVTRAKALLVIVGDPVPLIKDDNWGAMLRQCHEKKAYRGVPCASLEESRSCETDAVAGTSPDSSCLEKEPDRKESKDGGSGEHHEGDSDDPVFPDSDFKLNPDSILIRRR